MLILIQPAHLPISMHQVSFRKTPAPHVQVHALNTVLSVCGTTFTITAFTFGRFEVCTTVEFACGSQMRFLKEFEVTRLLLYHNLRFNKRIFASVRLLNNLIYFLFMSCLSVTNYLLFFHHLPTYRTLQLFLITISLMFKYFQKLPILKTETAFYRFIIDFRSKRWFPDLEFINSAEWTFGFLLSFFTLVNDVIKTSFAE